MTSKLFEIVKSGIQEEYAARKYNASFNEFLDQLERNPYKYTRTAFQMISDMMSYFGTRDILDCGEKITRYKLFDDPFDKEPNAEFGKHAVFGLDRQISIMANYIQTTANKGGDERIILLHGPQGTAKTSIIRLLINGLQHYSRTLNGGIYTFDWVFVEDEFAENVGFDLPHNKKCNCSKPLAHLKDEDVFIRVPCQMNDHPLMLVPKERRREYLQHVIENGHRDVVIPKILLENELCKNCQTIYDRLLDKYDGNLEKVMNHVQVLRLLVSEIEQIGAATVQPIQNVEGNARLLVKEGASYQNLASLFPGISLHQFEGKWVDANRGILHFSDMFKRDPRYHNSLLSAVQEHIQDFNGVQATVDAMIIATTNIEEYISLKADSTNKALLDRTKVFDIPYLVRISDEMKIYESKFKEAGYTESPEKCDMKHIMPHIREFVALFAVLTRLYQPNLEYYKDNNVDEGTLNIIDDLSPVQKAFIYDDKMPKDLETVEKKLITAPNIKRLLREEHNPLESVKITKKTVSYVKEGLGGISPRKVMDLITDVIGNKEDIEEKIRKHTCLGINDFKARLEKIVEAGIQGFVTYTDENPRYLNIDYLLKASIIEYDTLVQQDVQWSIIGMPKEELDKNIIEYIKHVQAWVDKSTIFNPVTKEYEPPSEKKMQWLEDLLNVKESNREMHRRSVIIDLAVAYQDARSEAEKDGILKVPPLDVPELFADYYECIYESLLEDSINKMKVSPEELKRSVQWLGTNKEPSINPPARQEIDRIITNLKKRAPYCDKCAKGALEYVFFDLTWDLNH